MTSTPALTPRRPYLLRAMHEWMTDNGQTPHIVVNAQAAGVAVPQQYVQDGRIILNISYSATQGLTMSNQSIEFNARFGGQTHHVVAPMAALLGVYARESGQGMVFGEEEGPPPEPAPEPPPSGMNDKGSKPGESAAKAPARGRAQLKVIK